MKLRNLILTGAVALPLMAAAMPAYKGVVKLPNPDGSFTEVRAHGDEFFSYVTDADNSVILQRNADGFLVPMMRNGMEVKPTMANIQMLRSEGEAAAAAQAIKRAPMQRMAALDSQGRTKFPTLATDIHSLVVLLEFKDIKFSHSNPKATFNDFLNKEGYTNEWGAPGSAVDFYKTMSYGKFVPTFDVTDVITLPENELYYVGDKNAQGEYGKYANWKEALEYAVKKMDEDGFDFSKYDYDGDGFIDTIYFIYAGYGSADTGGAYSPYIWPHQGSMYAPGYYNTIQLDGLIFGPYACGCELAGGNHFVNKDGAINGLGTFCHEFGHVLGLPDFYDPEYNSTSTTPGDWSLMDNGSYNGGGYVPPALSAYERWVCRWLEYTIPENGTHYELPALDNDGAIAVRLPVKRPNNGVEYTNEYFIAETRSKQSSVWDSKLPGEGMLIWHIDFLGSAWANNSVNSTKGHPRVSIVSSDGSANPFISKGSGSPSINAAWPGSAEIPSLYPGSYIALDTWASGSKGNANIYVTDITFDPATGVSAFDYNKYTEVPSAVTSMNTPVRLEDEETGQPINAVRLSWKPVEGATSYMLTMYRVNSSGTVFFENGLDEYIVGNVTSYDVRNLSDAKMGITYYAFVRAVLGIPSDEKSAEISFVPEQLNLASGVESIAAEDALSPVIGGKSCIIAPADAQIITLAGIATGRDNLAPGIYLVRTAQKVYKVVVR